jgi:hypothetical protein
VTADESTLGGYVAVHARPPAFEGVDGVPYSVDVVVDDTDDRQTPVGAFLLFVRWDGQAVGGHLETDFLAKGTSEAEVRDAIGRMPLLTVKATLDAMIRRGG